MTLPMSLRQTVSKAAHVLQLFGRDVGQGLLVVSHNTLALLGLVLVSLVTVFSTQDQLRHAVEHHALSWLSERQAARQPVDEFATLMAEPQAVQRVSAAELAELPRQQAAIAQWLARRYKVAPEAVARIVQEAWLLGERARIDPTLILAVVAVESSFNPFAQSPVGAQGLMQVMTHIHDDKYTQLGGERAALDPLANLRVGVQVLRDCIQRAGGVVEGLKHYVGAANLDHDDGYGAKVLFEQEQIKAVAAGRAPSTARPLPRQAEPAAPAASETEPEQIALAH